MLHSGCLWEPGTACLLLQGAQMVDAAGTLSKCRADDPPTRLVHDRVGVQMACRAAQALTSPLSPPGLPRCQLLRISSLFLLIWAYLLVLYDDLGASVGSL